MDLHSTRAEGAISNLEIHAFCQLNDLTMTPEEVALLKVFDNTFLKWKAAAVKK